MKSKKELLVGFINERLETLDIDNGKLFYILLNKNGKDRFNYNEFIKVEVNKNHTNAEKIKRIFDELYGQDFKMKFNDLLKIAEKYLTNKEITKILKEECYLGVEMPESMLNFSLFGFFEAYFYEYIRDNYDIKNANQFKKEVEDFTKQLNIQEEATYINYCQSRVKEYGKIIFNIKLQEDATFMQIYDYSIENGVISTHECHETLFGYGFNEFNDNLEYISKIPFDKIKSRKDYRSFQVAENTVNHKVESLSKLLLNLKLNDKLPEKNIKIKKTKI